MSPGWASSRKATCEADTRKYEPAYRVPYVPEAQGSLALLYVCRARYVRLGPAVRAAYRGTSGDMRAFSAIMNAVLIPLLSVVSLGRGLSPAVFASDGWMLALLGLFGMF